MLTCMPLKVSHNVENMLRSQPTDQHKGNQPIENAYYEPNPFQSFIPDLPEEASPAPLYIPQNPASIHGPSSSVDSPTSLFAPPAPSRMPSPNLSAGPHTAPSPMPTNPYIKTPSIHTRPPSSTSSNSHTPAPSIPPMASTVVDPAHPSFPSVPHGPAPTTLSAAKLPNHLRATADLLRDKDVDWPEVNVRYQGPHWDQCTWTDKLKAEGLVPTRATNDANNSQDADDQDNQGARGKGKKGKRKPRSPPFLIDGVQVNRRLAFLYYEDGRPVEGQRYKRYNAHFKNIASKYHSKGLLPDDLLATNVSDDVMDQICKETFPLFPEFAFGSYAWKVRQWLGKAMASLKNRKKQKSQKKNKDDEEEDDNDNDNDRDDSENNNDLNNDNNSKITATSSTMDTTQRQEGNSRENRSTNSSTAGLGIMSAGVSAAGSTTGMSVGTGTGTGVGLNMGTRMGMVSTGNLGQASGGGKRTSSQAMALDLSTSSLFLHRHVAYTCCRHGLHIIGKATKAGGV